MAPDAPHAKNRRAQHGAPPRLDGRLAPLPDPAPRREWRFPDPLGTQPAVATPLTETITITRHIAAREVIASINFAPLADLHDPDTPEPRAVDGRGRSAQTFVVDARARDGNHERGEPPTGATSTPSPRRLLLGEDRGASGARAPGDIFDAGGFLEALAPDQFTLAFWTRKVREGGGPGAASRYL